MPFFSGSYKSSLWRSLAQFDTISITNDVQCHVVKAYIQVGNVVAPDLPPAPDLKHRKACTAPAIHAFKKYVSGKVGFPTRDTVALGKSVLVSSFTFGAHLWDTINAKCLKDFKSHFNRLYQVISDTSPKCDNGVWQYAAPEVTMLVAARLDSTSFISLQRLRFLSRVITHGGFQLKLVLSHLLQHTAHGWPSLVAQDLIWFKRIAPSLSELPTICCVSDWAPWITLAADIPRWRCLLTQAVKHCLGHVQDQHRLFSWRQEIASLFPRYGLPQPPLFDTVTVEGGYISYLCGAIARSVAGRHVHRSSQHGIKRDLLDGISQPTCPECSTQHHTFIRLQRHLATTSCGIRVHQFVTPHNDEQKEQQRLAKKQQNADARCAGYLPIKAMVPCVKPPGWKRGKVGLNPTKLNQVIPPYAEFPPSQTDHVDVPSHIIVYYRFVLHLFSGQRRLGDLQCEIECIMDPASAALVLSIDIVNGTRGDLSDPENVLFWVRRIRCGHVILVIGGPPCNTWSAARFSPDATLQCENGRSKPRPVRSPTHLWGLECLSPSDRRNVDAGNLLLRAQSLIMWNCHFSHVPTLREHPSKPWRLDERIAPSSWDLPEEQLLYAQDGNCVAHFTQCLLGSDALKPTTFGFVAFTEMRNELLSLPGRGMCKRVMGANLCGQVHQRLTGTDPDGNFVTAPYKQYPQPMNARIARAALTHWTVHGACVETDLDEAFSDQASRFFVPLDPFLAEQSLGHYGADLAAARDNSLRTRQTPQRLSTLLDSAPCTKMCCPLTAHSFQCAPLPPCTLLQCGPSDLVEPPPTPHVSTCSAHEEIGTTECCNFDIGDDEPDVFNHGFCLDNSAGARQDCLDCKNPVDTYQLTEAQHVRISDNYALGLLRRHSHKAGLHLKQATRREELQARRRAHLHAMATKQNAKLDDQLSLRNVDGRNFWAGCNLTTTPRL